MVPEVAAVHEVGASAPRLDCQLYLTQDLFMEAYVDEHVVSGPVQPVLDAHYF